MSDKSMFDAANEMHERREQLAAEVERLKEQRDACGQMAADQAVEASKLRTSNSELLKIAEELSYQLNVYQHYHSAADERVLTDFTNWKEQNK